MGVVCYIAKRDILGFLSSFKAAGIFCFFLLIMGFFFQSFLVTFMEYQMQAPMYGGEVPDLEQLLRAIFYNTHFVLLLVIPAVTMSSFAEEKRTNSIRFLLSAPVSALQIVLGKYLALVGVMCLVLVCSMVYPAFILKYGNPDIGMIFSSYLGLFLLIASQLAFGIWVSSLTTNQFLAFLFTMFGLFLLLILNWIAPSIGSGTLEGVLKYIASTTHLDNLFKGLVSVSDIFYFLCFIFLFLFFTVVVVDSQRWR